MKLLTTFLITTALLFQGAIALAQIDEAKMERDLRVASGVLASLMNNDNDHLFGGTEPTGNYVEGFGVVFTIADQMIFKYNYKMQYEMARKVQKQAQKAVREVEIAQRKLENKQRNNDFVIVTPMPNVDVMVGIDEAEMKELKGKAEAANAEFSKNLKEAFENFLVDYSQLIGQLKPTDKILLATKNNSSYNFVFASDNQYSSRSTERSRLSAEMLVKDHKDYTAGKINRAKLLAKIKFIENAEMARKPDLDLFGNMLKTTYSSKYTETYFISSIPKYELLSGLGVVYSVKIYSSYNDDNGFRMPGLNKSGMSEEERNKAVETLYPQFTDSFKENMIRYGSTIKSLGESDKLIVKIKMTKCETCSFPGSIEFIVGKDVLSQFTKGNLTLAQAKAKVKLK